MAEWFSKKYFDCGFPSNIIVQGFIQQFWEKAPGQNWEKLLTQNIIGSKIYRKNQDILDCFML